MALDQDKPAVSNEATGHYDRAATQLKIILAAGQLVRRHGSTKTSVLDIARHLGVSHTNIYRHFDSKAAILDAVADHWLRQITERLEPTVTRQGSAEDRLYLWVRELSAIMEGMVREDPELFNAFNDLVEASRTVIGNHVTRLENQLQRIIDEGVASGEFPLADPNSAASAVLDGTIRFHHPFFIARPSRRGSDASYVLDLLLKGMKAPS